MRERMTDGRLAEIEARFKPLTGPSGDYPQFVVDARTLLQALKAERDYAAELEAQRRAIEWYCSYLIAKRALDEVAK